MPDNTTMKIRTIDAAARTIIQLTSQVLRSELDTLESLIAFQEDVEMAISDMEFALENLIN